MTLEEINKWLDNEYGVSYTKLEELHDFYFEKYCDLKKENQSLKKQLEERPKEYVFIGNAQNKTRDFINQITKDNKEFKTQQKKFINYLEDEKDRLARECSNIYEDSLGHTRLVNADKFDEVNDILQKYRSIIGDEK